MWLGSESSDSGSLTRISPRPSLAVGWTWLDVTSVPCPVGLGTGQLPLRLLAQQASDREEGSRSFCGLISEVTPITFTLFGC